MARSAWEPARIYRPCSWLLAGLKLQHIPYGLLAGNHRPNIRRISLDTHARRRPRQHQAGKVRALAISGVAGEGVTKFRRSRIRHRFGESSWYALFAPKGTPTEIIGKVNRDVDRVLTLPDVREKAVTLGYRLVGGTPAKLGEFLRNEITKWAELAQAGSFQ
jgi:hypothetical protein